MGLGKGRRFIQGRAGHRQGGVDIRTTRDSGFSQADRSMQPTTEWKSSTKITNVGKDNVCVLG